MKRDAMIGAGSVCSTNGSVKWYISPSAFMMCLISKWIRKLSSETMGRKLIGSWKVRLSYFYSTAAWSWICQQERKVISETQCTTFGWNVIKTNIFFFRIMHADEAYPIQHGTFTHTHTHTTHTHTHTHNKLFSCMKSISRHLERNQKCAHFMTLSTFLTCSFVLFSRFIEDCIMHSCL